MCRAGGTPAGAGRKLADARLWLWETRPAAYPSKHPSRCVASPPSSFPAMHASRSVCQDRPRAGCSSTPGACSTPTAATTSRSPGHPQRRDRARAAAGTRSRRGRPRPRPRSARSTANAQPGRRRTRRHARAGALRRAQASAREPAPPGSHRAAQNPRRRAVPREELRELVNQGNSLRAIAARYEISRRTIHDELVAHGIPIPPRDKLRRAIQRDWLDEQYGTKRRTTVDIAGELGVSRSTISKLLHQHGIPSAHPAPAATNKTSPPEMGSPSRSPAPFTAAAALTASDASRSTPAPGR